MSFPAMINDALSFFLLKKDSMENDVSKYYISKNDIR